MYYKTLDFFTEPSLVLPASKRVRFSLYACAILAQIPLGMIRKRYSYLLPSPGYFAALGLATCTQIFTTTVNPILGFLSAAAHCIGSRLMVLGVTGNMGCGKSTITNYLEQNGFHIIRANDISKELIEPGRSCHTQLVRECGTQILADPSNPASPLDPKVLRQLFKERSELKARFTTITRRALRKEIAWKVFQLRILQWQPRVAVEATRLYEERLHFFCAPTMLVNCDPRLQVERIYHRDRKARTLEQVENENSSNDAFEMKRKVADILVDNNMPLGTTMKFVRERIFHFFGIVLEPAMNV